MKVALALSGGGVRAAVFHCGVLQRLALDGLLESTTFVSTVSGGSLVVGLILCQNGHRWPGSEEFLDAVLPSVRARLTTATLQWSYAWRSVVLPWRLARGRTHVLAGQLEAQWGICGTMQDAPETPRWMVNATCYETGRNWRFSRRRMGDYVTNYVFEAGYADRRCDCRFGRRAGSNRTAGDPVRRLRLAPLREGTACGGFDASETVRVMGRWGVRQFGRGSAVQTRRRVP